MFKIIHIESLTEYILFGEESHTNFITGGCHTGPPR